MKFSKIIQDTQITRRPARSLFPVGLVPAAPRRQRDSRAGRVARAAVLEVLG
jgi:hypothetical protein